jgi:hypothetical protein
MQRPHFLIALLATAGLATAQNPFLLNGGGNVSNLANGGVPFEAFAGYQSSFLDGAGQTFDPMVGPVNRITGFNFLFIDLDPATSESISLNLSPSTTTMGGALAPDLSVAPLLSVGPLGTPPFGTPGVPGVISLTLNLATPFDGLPSSDFFLSVGVTTPQGGVAFQPAATTGNTGANANVPTDTTWLFDNGAMPGLFPIVPGAALIGFLSEGPVLRLGADIDPTLLAGAGNPHFGLAGLYPDTTRQDGIAVRITDADNPASPGVLLVDLMPFGSPLSLPGFLEGDLFVQAPLVTLPFTTDANGVFQQTLVSFPFAVPGGVTSSYQAAVLSLTSGRLRLSNVLNRTE